jgi:hypothetical protein
MKKKIKISAHVSEAMGSNIKVSIAASLNKQFEV